MVSSGRNGTKEWVRAAQAAPLPLLPVFMLHPGAGEYSAQCAPTFLASNKHLRT